MLMTLFYTFVENKLTINAKKTKYMPIASSSKKLKRITLPKLLLGGTTLLKTNEFKYLGITIDSCLNFNKHIEITRKAIIYKIYLLNRVRFDSDEAASLEIYKSMILPHFTYGDVIYSATSQGNLAKMQRVQNRGLRVCIRPEERVSTDNLHRLAGVNKLEDLRWVSLLGLTFKRTGIRKYVDQRNIRTRAHDFPVLKTVNNIKIKYEKSVEYRTFKLWSDTHRDIKSIASYPQLKNHIHKVLDNKLV